VLLWQVDGGGIGLSVSRAAGALTVGLNYQTDAAIAAGQEQDDSRPL
jgi:hypothetical protein